MVYSGINNYIYLEEELYAIKLYIFWIIISTTLLFVAYALVNSVFKKASDYIYDQINQIDQEPIEVIDEL